jgi:polar amino acid transport system substrate-binding protein
MKKMMILLLIIMRGALVVVSAEEPVKMVYSANGKPLCWGEGDTVQGILIDVSIQVFKKLRVAATHNGFPWVRAQKMVEEGSADGFITIPTTERRSYADIGTEPVVTMKMVMIVKANSPKIGQLKIVKKASDLKPFVVLSYNGNSWAKDFLKDLNVDWAVTVEQCLNKLVAGRGDVYISDENSEKFRIKKLNLEKQLVILPTVLDQRDFYLCIRKSSSHVKLIPKFDQALKQIKAEGILQKILDKYNAGLNP